MEDRPPLSKGELQVARVLWDCGESTVRQIHESLPAERAMEFATVQTYLRRLEQKGYATAKLVGRTRHYRARVRPQTVIRQTVGELVDQLFDGDAMPLVRHLVEDRSLSSAEISQLRQMVDELDQGTSE
ncbi:BlaI/MecI/CopY family transcriptional regulator [Stieleria sp. TO1_6]|uniref:BlaI/MecI/CopY family transcriptional regulator n=1 Tax=Stieleria tagensis TaxID=2956795 RepID=UPI00209AED05|nr:BlaI/MecI/CopY family transcriptional regulator [Stieleria tagensis]MCO8120693.1 BlaI/MecI/CopY family transcriptional regulator [Stieleria tagensis]